MNKEKTFTKPVFSVCPSVHRSCLQCLFFFPKNLSSFPSLCPQNPFPASVLLSTIPVLSICPVYSTFFGICLPFCSTMLLFLPTKPAFSMYPPKVYVCLSKVCGYMFVLVFFSLMQTVRVLYKDWDKDNQNKILWWFTLLCNDKYPRAYYNCIMW